MKRTEKATKAAKSKQQVATAETPSLELPFSQVYYTDEDGDKQTLDEFSNGICEHLLNLDNTLYEVTEKFEEKVAKKIAEMIHPKCPDCGNKLSQHVFCRHCEKDFTADPL